MSARLRRQERRRSTSNSKPYSKPNSPTVTSPSPPSALLYVPPHPSTRPAIASASLPLKALDRVPSIVKPASMHGFPTYDEFTELVNNYIASLHPRKALKALIDQEMYAKILRTLRYPDDVSVGNAQFRFWARKMFQLKYPPGYSPKVKSSSTRKRMRATNADEHDSEDDDDDDYTCFNSEEELDPQFIPILIHETRPVAIKHDIYSILCHFHSLCTHGGRDRTTALVRDHYSYVPKVLVAAFVAKCPTCMYRRTGDADLLGKIELPSVVKKERMLKPLDETARVSEDSVIGGQEGEFIGQEFEFPYFGHGPNFPIYHEHHRPGVQGAIGHLSNSHFPPHLALRPPSSLSEYPTPNIHPASYSLSPASTLGILTPYSEAHLPLPLAFPPFPARSLGGYPFSRTASMNSVAASSSSSSVNIVGWNPTSNPGAIDTMLHGSPPQLPPLHCGKEEDVERPRLPGIEEMMRMASADSVFLPPSSGAFLPSDFNSTGTKGKGRALPPLMKALSEGAGGSAWGMNFLGPALSSRTGLLSIREAPEYGHVPIDPRLLGEGGTSSSSSPGPSSKVAGGSSAHIPSFERMDIDPPQIHGSFTTCSSSTPERWKSNSHGNTGDIFRGYMHSQYQSYSTSDSRLSSSYGFGPQDQNEPSYPSSTHHNLEYPRQPYSDRSMSDEHLTYTGADKSSSSGSGTNASSGPLTSDLSNLNLSSSSSGSGSGSMGGSSFSTSTSGGRDNEKRAALMDTGGVKKAKPRTKAKGRAKEGLILSDINPLVHERGLGEVST